MEWRGSRILLVFAMLIAGAVSAPNVAIAEGKSIDRAPLYTHKNVRVAGAVDTYLVKFKDTVNVHMMEDILNGLKPMLESFKAPSTITRIFRNSVRAFEAELYPDALDFVRTMKVVEFVEVNQEIKLPQTDTFSHERDEAVTEVALPWGLDRIDQRNLPLDGKFDIDGTGKNVSVYFIDTGIHTSHEDFGGRAQNVFDAYDSDLDELDDCNGHGTHVAATAGGKTYGVAKESNLYGLRALDCNGSGTSGTVISAIDWIQENAIKPAILSLSIGTTDGPSLLIDLAVLRLMDDGITVVVAAGNANSDACNSSPADLVKVISVGASDKHDTRAAFSNIGICVDIFAPGVDVRSAYIGDSNSDTKELSGTSMSAPHVSGAAAILLQQYPTLGPEEVKSKILDDATNDIIVDAGEDSNNKLIYIRNSRN